MNRSTRAKSAKKPATRSLDRDPILSKAAEDLSDQPWTVETLKLLHACLVEAGPADSAPVMVPAVVLRRIVMLFRMWDETEGELAGINEGFKDVAAWCLVALKDAGSAPPRLVAVNDNGSADRSVA